MNNITITITFIKGEQNQMKVGLVALTRDITDIKKVVPKPSR